MPGELPDTFGGRTAEVAQVNWGMRAQKDTWLYIVTSDLVGPVVLLRGAKPTHVVTTSRANRASLPECGKVERRLTPPAFAEFLVALARQCVSFRESDARNHPGSQLEHPDSSGILKP